MLFAIVDGGIGAIIATVIVVVSTVAGAATNSGEKK